jgi:PAS domain S-box-containing protein
MTFLYNEAYLQVLGSPKHPRALGSPASKVLAEIWDVCGPVADQVFRNGEASFVDDMRLFVDRGNFLEETFYSFSYSPIRDESGAVAGLFCPSIDVTPKVLNARRLRTVSALTGNSLVEKTTANACAIAGSILSNNPEDVPFALLYLADAENRAASLEQIVGTFGSDVAKTIDLTSDATESTWPIAKVFRTAQRQIVSTGHIPGLPADAANQPVVNAVMLPVVSRGERRPYGVLVAGINPCRPIDADHLTFFDLVAGQVAAAIQNARAMEREKKRADMMRLFANAELEIEQRRHTEDLLRQSELRFREMIDALPAAIYTTDAEGRLTYFNPASVQLSGRVPELGVDPWSVAWKLVQPDGTSLPPAEDPMARALREGRIGRGEEYIGERPDGSRFWFTSYPSPFRDAEGRITGGINMLVDVTDRKEAEEALRGSDERVRGVFESSAIGVAILTMGTRFLRANRAFCTITGYSEEDLRTFDCYRLTHPDDLAPMQKEVARLMRGEISTFVLEQRYFASDGRTIWVNNCVSAMRDREGRPGYLIALCEDVTTRIQAEAALRESEERFRAIVETTPECVKLVAADGTLLHMNSSGLAILGASSAGSVIGGSVYDLVAPEFREAFRSFNEMVCSGERGSLEFDIITLKGDRRHMDTRAAPLRRPDGTVAQLAITRDVTERKGTEQAIWLLGAIVDSSDDAIISKDLNGVIMSWNRSAELLFGYTAEEAVGKPVTLIIPPDRLDEEPGILSRLKRGERVNHFETVRRRKDGTLLDISLTISPVRDAQGKIIGASKIARDISERRRAEKAIQALNAQLTAELSAMTRLQKLSTRLVLEGDLTESLGEIVDAGLEITGANMGNIQLFEDDGFRIVSHCGFGEPFAEFFNRGCDGDATCGMALKRGERIIVEDVAESPVFAGTRDRLMLLTAGARAMQVTPLLSRSGHFLGIFSTYYHTPHRPNARELRLLDLLSRQAADLIERTRAASALCESEARFRQLADSMPQMVWTARPDGYTDYYNERWYEFTGYGRDRFGDDSFATLLHPEDLARCLAIWHERVTTGRPYQIEFRFWDRDENRWRWFMGRALPVRDDGKIVKWFGTWTDIDEQKRVEDELRRANLDLEQFAYSASHDLQEPLRTIKIYGELLTRRYSNRLDGQASEFLDYLRTGASRMEMLVRDLLAYTQVTKLDAPIAATDANATLSATLADLSSAIAESAARVTYDPLPAVQVHSTHLKQLFQNLVGNAIKYRDPERKPVVHVSAEQHAACWVFSVRDNGIGIEPEYKEQIFGLFKRLHTGDQYSGTGLGLAICHRIVERYQGRIWVESDFGQGSAFFFEIPV